MNARTAWVNEVRGLPSEDGIVWPQSLATCHALSVGTREAEQAQLTALSTEVFRHLDEEVLALEPRLASDARRSQP
jgi:hypothetical protein